MLWMLPAIMGLNLVKHFASDRPQAQKQNQLKADAIRNSAFNRNINPEAIPVPAPDIFSNLAGGAASGLTFGNALNKWNRTNKLFGMED